MTCPLCSSTEEPHDRQACAERLTEQEHLAEVNEQHARDFRAMSLEEQRNNTEGNYQNGY